MSYRYLDDVTLADVAFIAEGKTLAEMFESAALAVANTMIKELKTVERNTRKTFRLKHTDIEKLLFEFLQELVYWKDAKLLIFSKVDVKIEEKEGSYFLKSELLGDKINENHEQLVDVKAVTWHKFSVKKNGKWSCHIILDI